MVTAAWVLVGLLFWVLLSRFVLWWAVQRMNEPELTVLSVLAEVPVAQLPKQPPSGITPGGVSYIETQ